ncbi:MAG: glutamate-5-semialdehyde dehydrogenase [Clostridia bacterium]|nr:glutamate-5-semialdehyde dehydrogenase [Clostridia bacterium]
MLELLGKQAKAASYQLMNISTAEKENALLAIADSLENNIPAILAENKKDVDALKEKGGTQALIDRLTLTEKRIKDMADGARQVKSLPDPVGEVLGMTKRPNGLVIGKKRVPLGVIGIIYEARPNVTVDAAVLCLKTSNACILRGGSEAINSNKIIVDTMTSALDKIGFPAHSVQLLCDTSRETATRMMKMNEYLDVLIPRGGAGLIKSVVQNATVPVIETGTGNCHIYIESTADIKMGVDIITNAKTSRPAVCNAAETLLVDEKIAEKALPMAYDAMKEFNVEWRGCEKSCKILPQINKATEEDYQTEYNDYILAVKVVSGLDEAIAHINKYGTGHSEAIITSDYFASNRFLNEVDAAAVYVNASTRFTDGFEFGFGAEIGISTQKLHARGPMGLCELTTTKYIIYGDGQVRR